MSWFTLQKNTRYKNRPRKYWLPDSRPNRNETLSDIRSFGLQFVHYVQSFRSSWSVQSRNWGPPEDDIMSMPSAPFPLFAERALYASKFNTLPWKRIAKKPNNHVWFKNDHVLWLLWAISSMWIKCFCLSLWRFKKPSLRERPCTAIFVTRWLALAWPNMTIVLM